MTRLGTIVFSAIGLAFVAFVALMIRLALRSGPTTNRDELAKAGWAVAEGSGNVRWRASRELAGVTATVTVTQTGTRTRSSRTLVELPATGPGELLVTRKGPALLAVDGALASAIGFTPPPRWTAGSADFHDVADAFATDDATGARWLTAASQAQLASALRRVEPLLGVSRAQGRWTAQLSGEIADPVVIDGVVALLVALRGP